MSVPTFKTLTALTLLLTLGLSGCVGGSGDDGSDASTDPDPALGAPGETGSVEGSILDEEGRPVEGVTIGLVEIELATLTDADGLFSFPAVAVGTYRLVTDKISFEAAARDVEVLVGQATIVDITLVELEVELDPVIISYSEDGFITCALTPYWPISPCNQAGVGNDRSKIPFQIENPLPFKEVILELVWEPTTAVTSQTLEMDVCDEIQGETFYCEGGLTGDAQYWFYTSGPSPQRARLADLPVPEVTRYQATVAAGYLEPTPTFQQPFTLYITFCFVEKCPDEYTAMPG